MPIYRYKAYEASGIRVQDTIEAANERDAFRRLAARGLTVAHLQMEERRSRSRPRVSADQPVTGSLFTRRLKQEDVAVICRELAIMISAGVPIADALISLLEGTQNPVIHAGLSRVLDEIRSGTSLSDAIRSAPRVFPSMLADIVCAAEEGGSLAAALDTAATQIEKTLDFRRKVVSALTYPVLLLCIAALTASVLVAFVLPRFSKIFQNMGVPTPPTTKVLLAVAAFVQHTWPYFLVSLVMLWFVWRRLLQHRPFATAWTRFLMHLPIVGDLFAKVALVRALGTLSSMLSCNVPLLNALAHAGKVSGNYVLEDGFAHVASRVQGGRAMAESLKETEVFPNLIIQMTNVGERTGSLADVLAKTVAFFESEVDGRLRSLTSILEPLLIVALGVFVGFITISVITPIYSLVGKVR